MRRLLLHCAGARSIQVKQNSQSERRVQAAIQQAQEELEKAGKQFEKELKDLEKNSDPAAIQKLQDEMRKASQKIQDKMLMAKDQLDRIGQEYRSIQVGPGGEQFDVFGAGGGYSLSAGRVIWDGGTGQMILSGPGSMAIISDPEAKELRDKEQECKDKIEKIVDHYNSTPATALGDRAAIKIELEKAVGEQFDIRQKYRELQIKQLEKELARIRESIQKRNDNREQIIKHHMAQLLHEQEDLEF